MYFLARKWFAYKETIDEIKILNISTVSNLTLKIFIRRILADDIVNKINANDHMP